MKLSLHKRFEQFQHNQAAIRNLEFIVYAVLIISIAAFVVRPTVTHISTMNDYKKEVETLLSQLQTRRANLDSAEQAVISLEDSFPLYEDALPNAPKQFDLLNTLRVVAENKGVSLTQLVHTFDENGKVSFTVTGGGAYNQITDYIEALEKTPRLLEISQIVLATATATDVEDQPGLTLSIVGSGFYYEEPVDMLQEVTEQQ